MLPTVANVELDRYMGHWHEVFRLPNSFQTAGAQATADYSLEKDGTVKVLNKEKSPTGKVRVATGRAEAVPGSGNARLRVQFSWLASLVPVSEEGNYWIIRLAPDYSTVLVGTPDRKYLWLLARNPDLSKKEAREYEVAARRLGFDTSKLIYAK